MKKVNLNMKTNNTWLEDNFFLYTSENIPSIQSHLFGFALIGNKFYKNCDLNMESVDFSKASGAFIAIIKKGEEILIVQDAMGSYYIYFFRKDKYWAISNSFWMICDEVSKKYPLTLNEDIAVHFMNVTMSQLSIEHTLANEISTVPLHSILIISGKKLTVITEEKHFCRYAVDSAESIAIIDGWITKWAGMIKMLYEAGMPLQFDLSGGFDSRIVFALACAAGIDFSRKNVSVRSYVPKTAGEKEHYKDDFKIAENIAAKYSFKLNEHLNFAKTKKIPQEVQYQIFQHVFMNTHKEVYLKNKVYEMPLFHFGGMCGEPVRGKTRSFDEWLLMIGKDSRYKAVAFKEFLYAYEAADPSCEGEKMKEYVRLLRFYLSTWQRNHYGLTMVNNAIVNEYTLAPLGDESLLQINPLSEPSVKSDIVYALILKRSCPGLLNIPFANQEGFASKTIAYAEKVSAKYACDFQIDKMLISHMDTAGLYRTSSFGEENAYAVSAEKLLEKDFLNHTNRQLFFNKFGSYGYQIWEEAEKRYKDTSLFFPSKYIVPLVAIIKMLCYERSVSVCKNDLFTEQNEQKVLEALLRHKPESNILRKMLFWEYMKSKMHEKAEELLQSGFLYHGDVALLHYLFACLLYEKSENHHAWIHIKECVQIEPNDLEYWRLYFKILVGGQFAEKICVKEVKNVCVAHKQDYRYWMELAKIYAGYGKNYRAVITVYHAIKLHADDRNVYHWLLVYMRKVNKHLALIKAEEILKRDPLWHEGYAQIAYIAVDCKDYIKACVYMQQAATLAPQHSGYQKLLKVYLRKREEMENK